MLFALAAVLIGSIVAAEPATPGGDSHSTVVGTVTLTDARGEAFDAPGVDLALACAPTPDEPQSAATNEHGVFRFADVRPGRCSLTAELQGFGTVTTTIIVPAAETLAVEIHLAVAPLEAGIGVVGQGTCSWQTRPSK